jgi:hypothetical protein
MGPSVRMDSGLDNLFLYEGGLDGDLRFLGPGWGVMTCEGKDPLLGVSY